MIRTKVQTIEKSVLLDLQADLAPEARSRTLAEFAQAAINEADAHNDQALGRDVVPRVFVDRVEGAPLQSVKPDGVIVAVWEVGDDLLQFIRDSLQEAAPVLRGAFRKSIKIYADNVEVAEIEQARDADEVVFASTVPYARKIEGSSRRPPQSRQAPNGVFEVVAVLAAKRFGNIARVRFAYRDISGAAGLERWASRNASRLEGVTKRRRQYQKNIRQPAIVVTFR